MVKLLLIVNTLLTFPFGIAALAAPVQVFAQFGIELSAYSLPSAVRRSQVSGSAFRAPRRT
jgi:hypothetical protein